MKYALIVGHLVSVYHWTRCRQGNHSSASVADTVPLTVFIAVS